ncbi:MAG: hypothetical protein AB8U91_04315, partial [Candidatus Midichloria sp.]
FNSLFLLLISSLPQCASNTDNIFSLLITAASWSRLKLAYLLSHGKLLLSNFSKLYLICVDNKIHSFTIFVGL